MILKVVCIRSGVPSITIGRTYVMMGADTKNNKVRVVSDLGTPTWVEVNKDVIFMELDPKQVGFSSDSSNNTIATVMYLTEAFSLAGGAPIKILEKIQSGMSARDLIGLMSANKIRFTYMGAS